jgi:hypothetical protein
MLRGREIKEHATRGVGSGVDGEIVLDEEERDNG